MRAEHEEEQKKEKDEVEEEEEGLNSPRRHRSFVRCALFSGARERRHANDLS